MCASCVGIGWVSFVVHVDMRRSLSVVIGVEFGRIEVFGCISCVLIFSAGFMEFLSTVFGSEVLWFSWMSCMGVVFSFIVCCRCTTLSVRHLKPGGRGNVTVSFITSCRFTTSSVWRRVSFCSSLSESPPKLVRATICSFV